MRSARGGRKVLGGVMFCLVLHCFAYVLQKTAVANVQPESARGGPKVLGGVQERNISKRQQEWGLENQLLAPYHCVVSYSTQLDVVFLTYILITQFFEIPRLCILIFQMVPSGSP